jgi:hypothetical protein
MVGEDGVLADAVELEVECRRAGEGADRKRSPARLPS